MKGAVRREGEATHGHLEGKDVVRNFERRPKVPERDVDRKGLE